MSESENNTPKSAQPNEYQLILKNNREFITGVAVYGNSPNKDNKYLVEVITAYKQLVPNPEEVPYCLTCGNFNPLTEIYNYCKLYNWWE